MKIAIIVDKPGTAIDRLAQLIKQHADRHEFKIVPLHPKRASESEFAVVEEAVRWADLVDVHYWKCGDLLADKYPDLWKSKKKILFHFNPYDLDKKSWREMYDAVVVGNKNMAAHLPSAHLIEYGLDLSFWKFNNNWANEPQPKKPIIQMTVGRIEKTKGVREVAQACRELDYTLYLVGRVSKPDYMKEVLDKGGTHLRFYEDIDDLKLRDVYYQSTVHVCNSWDDFESGTLPILEAMACGVPVLTRNVGHVPDLSNGRNMVVREKKEYDIEDLKMHLKEIVESPERLKKMREAAWDTVKGRDSRKMVRRIIRMYQKVREPQHPLVSVIIPTKDNHECLADCLVKVSQQDYHNFEIIVADSGVGYPITRQLIEAIKKHKDVTIKHIVIPWSDHYNLAEARNKAVIEAEGSILMFCDDRIGMKENAISEFKRYLARGSWLWGVKDDAVKAFVENFSMVYRDDVIIHGMFNEEIRWYGGMSEEIRRRFEQLGRMNFELIQTARAYQIKAATKKANRREQIIEAKNLLDKIYG